MLTFLLGAFLPIMSSSPDLYQRVLSTPPKLSVPFGQQAAVLNFSAPFNPREYEPYQHMARCTGINRSVPGRPSVKEIQLRKSYISSCHSHFMRERCLT